MRDKIHSSFKVLVLTGIMAASAVAEAQDPDTGPESADTNNDRGSLILGAKVGGLIPFNGLSPNVRGGLEVGYVLPWLERSLAVAVVVDYAAPSTEGSEGSEKDPRVPTGEFDWELNEKQLGIMPIVMYRFNGLGTITPFAGIGPRVTMLRSTVSGSSGSTDFGETTEQSTAFGVGIPIGAEFELGPGALLAELMFEYGGLDHRATGDASTAGTTLMVGYRFLL